MSHAFIDEDAFVLAVPATPATFRGNPNMQHALDDLRKEGLDNLDEIAEFYNIDPRMLRGRFMRRITQ